jgi:ACS family pantothenate transporter-like MFS transporter
MGKAAEQKTVSSTSDVEAGSSDSANSSQEHIVKPISTWKGYIWDTWELPKEERWLLFKVDAFVLTFASVRSPTLSYCSCLA